VRIERVAAGMDWSSAGSWTLPWRGLRRNDGLQQAIGRALDGRTIEALQIPFAAAATRLDTGQGVALDRGPADSAVAASSAVPVLFVPVRRDGIDLVDGSLSAPLPVDIARQRGATVVLAVDVAYRPSEAPARDITDVAFQSMHILINALAAEQAARADIVLRLNLHHLAMGSDPAALIAAGERALHDAWPRLRERLGR
jgi:NTE family protein